MVTVPRLSKVPKLYLTFKIIYAMSYIEMYLTSMEYIESNDGIFGVTSIRTRQGKWGVGWGALGRGKNNEQ